MNRRRIPTLLVALSITLALAVVVAIDARVRHEPLLKVQVSRQTWCPSPEMRSSIPLDDIPPRGADVTPIVGASSMTPTELAEAVNRLIGQVNPAVALRSVSLSWPAGSGDAVLVVAWERAR